MKKTHHSLFPALSVKRMSEPVAIDTVCCDAPATDEGLKCAHAFVVDNTLLTDAHGVKSDK